MKNLIYFLLIFTIYSCNQKDDQSGKTENAGDRKSKTPRTSTTENNKSETGSSESSGEKENSKSLNPEPVRVKFPEGATQTNVNGYIEGFAHNLTYVFEVSKGQKLTASVKAKNGIGNIRINQIINPQGKADGPFSNEMTYDLNVAGDWKLVIGEDMMAGEPWKGEFVLKLETK